MIAENSDEWPRQKKFLLKHIYFLGKKPNF